MLAVTPTCTLAPDPAEAGCGLSLNEVIAVEAGILVRNHGRCFASPISLVSNGTRFAGWPTRLGTLPNRLSERV